MIRTDLFFLDPRSGRVYIRRRDLTFTQNRADEHLFKGNPHEAIDSIGTNCLFVKRAFSPIQPSDGLEGDSGLRFVDEAPVFYG